MTTQSVDEALGSVACTECPYIFTEAEIAAEDENDWGHPCYGVKGEVGTVCESFREPVAPAPVVDEAPVHIYVNAKCAAIPMNGVYTLTQHDGDLKYTRPVSNASPAKEAAYKAVVEALRECNNQLKDCLLPEDYGHVINSADAALAAVDALEPKERTL